MEERCAGERADVCSVELVSSSGMDHRGGGASADGLDRMFPGVEADREI